jgi:hypothetical protein
MNKSAKKILAYLSIFSIATSAVVIIAKKYKKYKKHKKNKELQNSATQKLFKITTETPTTKKNTPIITLSEQQLQQKAHFIKYNTTNQELQITTDILDFQTISKIEQRYRCTAFITQLLADGSSIRLIKIEPDYVIPQIDKDQILTPF